MVVYYGNSSAILNPKANVNNSYERQNIMKNQDEFSQKDKKSFWESKTFLAVSAICLIAIGVASFVAYGAMNKPPVSNNGTSSNTLSRPDIVSKEPTSSIPPVVSEEPTVSTPTVSNTVSETKPSNTTPPPVASFFIMPMSAGTVYKEFSDTRLQYSNTYDDYRLHSAVDITSDKTSSVTSCGEGIITAITKEELWGTVITIDHGNGIIARYCGFVDKVKVKVGDTVTSTTVLGELGTVPCECLDAKHLHLEFCKNGNAVSPLELFN